METRSRKRLKLYETLKKNPKYKLRKLSVGVVSFLTGFAVLYGGSVTVSAQEVANQDKRVLEELVNEIKEPNAPDMVDISTEEPKVYGESQETVDTDETTETSINENTFNENKEEDKSHWPSMIADRSNEGQPLATGIGFRTATSNSEENVVKINLEAALKVLGGYGYKVANPFLLSSEEKAHILAKIKETSPEFFANDTTNKREIEVTDNGLLKFKNSEASTVEDAGKTYSIDELFDEADLEPLENRNNSSLNPLKKVPISKLVDFKSSNSNGLQASEDPLKSGKKLFIDLTPYDGDKESAYNDIMTKELSELPTDLQDVKFAALNSLIESLKKEGFNPRFQNYSVENPNGIDMWGTGASKNIGANNATVFLDTSNKTGFYLNIGYYDDQGAMPTVHGIPGQFNAWKDSLGDGPAIGVDLYELIVNNSADIMESEASKNPPTVNNTGAYYISTQSLEEQKTAITNAVSAPTTATKTVVGAVPNTDGTSNVKVVVKYEDGSYKEVEVPVTVKQQWDKEIYTPVTTPVEYIVNTPKDKRDEAVLAAVTATNPAGGTIKTKEIVGATPNVVGDRYVVTVKVVYADGSEENASVDVKVTSVAVTEKESTLQKLGAWTDTNFEVLPSNLGDTPAQNQGAGRVIEYSTEQWNESDNYNIFGWKPREGGKIAFSKDGFNAINRPPGNITYQDGFVGASINDNRLGSTNLLILANYQEKDKFKGVYREVDVTGEREIAFKSSVSGLTLLPSGDKFKVTFINAETNVEIATHTIETAQTPSTNRVVMLPEGTNRVRVELIPLYNQTGINGYPQWRYNSFVNQFELFRGSKMEDALPASESIQLFRNGETETYKFTVKNDGNGEKGTNGRLSIAPYYGNPNTVNDTKLNASVDLSFEETLENGAVLVDANGDVNSKVVVDFKPTLYANDLKAQDAQVTAGTSKELLIKTIDLTKKNFEKPTEILVTDYKLNYGTKNYSINRNKAADPYINREATIADSPYRQDVVANSQEAAVKYGDQVTSKTVSENATGRKIIILMNKTKLRAAIEAENLKQLNKDDYTAESWNAYQEALARANAIIKEDETTEYLREDTATKLAKMASQSDINELSELLPMILVKSPVIAGENGSVTSTPDENTVKMTVKYKDGDKDITVEVTKLENPKATPDAAPTYSWSITGVATVEGSNPTVHSTAAPEGVTVDSATGKVTIANANVSDGTTVTASDVNVRNAVSKEVTAVKPNSPTVTVTDRSTVTVAPPSDENVNSITLSYTDAQDKVKTVTVTKATGNTWAVDGEAHGVTVDEATGLVTISDNLIKLNTFVTAKAKGLANLESSDASANLTYAKKYDPTVSAGSVSVNKDDVTTPEQKETLKTDILNKVTVAAEAGNVTKEVQGDLPTTVGSHQVPVKVTYADGTEDTVNVPVDITETQAQKDAAIAGTKRTLLPRTGETTDVGMYAGLVALSAIGCLTGFKKRKKEEALSDE